MIINKKSTAKLVLVILNMVVTIVYNTRYFYVINVNTSILFGAVPFLIQITVYYTYHL